VTLCATIITSKGEEKESVPVPDDARKRSVKVVHDLCVQRKSGGSRETPEELVGRGWAKWLAGRPKPPNQWRVVDKETGDSLGARLVPISVSVDKTNGRATVSVEKITAALQKYQMGAVSAASLRPEKGVTERRFFHPSLEGAASLFCKDYLDGSMDVLDRKCRGLATKEDKGLKTHAKKSHWPSLTKAKHAHAETDLYILRATFPPKGTDWGNGPNFVGETMEEAQAQCQRQVSTSAWKCVPSI